MVRSVDRRLPVTRALALVGLAIALAAACGGPQAQVGSGGVCFRSDDCKPGFACVPETVDSSKRVCSRDLSLIVSMVDGAPPEAAAPATGGEAGANGGGGRGGESTTGGSPATGGAQGGNGGSPGPIAGAGGASAGASTGGAGLSAGTGG